MAPLKILVCGSINGHYAKFVKRINTINKKNGPFEMVLCSGNFFSPTKEFREKWVTLMTSVKLDVPVYILGPTTNEYECFYSPDKLIDGDEITENLLYLGRRGIFKTSSGLVIAYLSGKEKSNLKCSISKTDDYFKGVDILKDVDVKIQLKCSISKTDVTALKEQAARDDNFKGVDILLTTAWPRGVMKYIKSDVQAENEALQVSLLATSLKPRYHLTCHSERFFERTPYRNHQVLRQEQQHVSRFIALAPYGNPTGEKSVYAFVITPMAKLPREELIKQPDDVTEFPYKDILNAKSDQGEETQQFFFKNEDLKRKPEHQGGDGQRKIARGPPKLSSACWFCLGSQGVEKHLVVSVGEHCYVALAKGALNEEHVLICPITHINSVVALPDDARMEMERYKDGLRKLFEQEKKTLVSFERNFYTQHLQLQVFGIPQDIAGDVRDTFQDFADNCMMELIDVPIEKDLTELVAITTPYFAVDLPDGGRLLHKVKGKMPLQFGREVLASPSLLNLPNRVDWKNCKLTKEEETAQTKDFRKKFQPFDFNFQ